MNRKTNLKTWGVMVVVLVGVLAGGVRATGTYDGGDGSPGDPFQINTPAQMDEIGQHSEDWASCFILTADIDLSAYTGTSFNIIGILWQNPFRGTFDGNGHTISNFTYTSTGTDYIGLFGCTREGANIKDLGLINPNVDAGNGEWVGGLVGHLDGYPGSTFISNCYVEGGSVSGGSEVGGLVGYISYGLISNCYSTASVTGAWDVGGLVGRNYGTVSNCYATGSVSGTTDVGGLVGINDGPVSNCYAAGSVSGNSRVGGLVGYIRWNVLISNCYSTGSVSGTSDVGGLVGLDEAATVTVFNSFWDTQTSGQTTSAGGTGKTTAEMKDINTFLAAGWDFVGEYENGPNDDWAEPAGGGYMILWWQVPENELPPLPTFSGGAGTESEPYLISNATDLNRIGHNGRLMGKHFKLINDIDLMGIDLFVIGSPWYDYSGIFDGNGHTISNFTYSSTGTDYIGLFVCVDGPSAEIKDLGLIDPNVDAGTGDNVGSLVGQLRDGAVSNCYTDGASVTGDWYVGGLVGEIYRGGTITNCYSESSVSGSGDVGGLVGHNKGTMSNSYATGSVSGTGNYVGGLVGDNLGGSTITNCYSTGSVSGNVYVGGLAGSNRGTISNCYSSANVSGDDNVGGLLGRNYGGIVTDCHSTGSVSGNGCVGGLVGWNNESTVSNCYATGTVTGTSSDIGGLMGFSGSGTIINCYYRGTVSGTKEVGGLVGWNYESTVSNCYATGTVTGTSSDIGGLVGTNSGTLGIISSCYSTANVSGDDNVGGLVGNHYGTGTIYNCYSTGSVWGTGSYIGGLAGSSAGTIYNCYSTGSVSGGGSVGGLVGIGGPVFGSFWDIQTSGQTTSAGGIGLPTAQMQMESSFTSVGWDFVYVWDICEGTNYPKLAWQVPVLGDFGCPDGVDWNDVEVLSEQWLLEELSWDVWPNDGDGIVNFFDWGVFASEWKITNDIAELSDFADQWLQTGVNYYIADIAPPPEGDGIVDFRDFAAQAANWLAGL